MDRRFGVLTLLVGLNVALIAFGLSLDDADDGGDAESATSLRETSTVPVTDGSTTSLSVDSTAGSVASTTIAAPTTVQLAADDGLT